MSKDHPPGRHDAAYRPDQLQAFDAFARLAEELGRLIGRFLEAEETKRRNKSREDSQTTKSSER